MVNKKERHSSPDALEIIKLSLRVQMLEGKLKALQDGRTMPDNLSDQADNLRHSLINLKLKMQRNPQPEDQYRKLALENELGRILLQIDGVL